MRMHGRNLQARFDALAGSDRKIIAEYAYVLLMASSTAIIALLVVARNHIESITQQICAKPCSKANPRDFRNPALLEMSQRYAITQTKSQLFLNFTHLRTTNAIGYQRFDLEKSGTNLRVGQKRLGKLGGDVFATRRFAIACD